MASRLYSNCQLEGTVCGHPTWFENILVVFRRVQTFHPAAIPSRLEVGPSFDTFIQYLESESSWKPYTTCQGTP